ncbi:MAG: spermidine synthase [Nitrospinae bacterium]|nr:spermidine synthase [Nitrospinota bacterium]MZH14739.1 spermidine synthase [Nitrospinota bacterium]
MGNTQYSIATVLTAFMGGLALGSYTGGKIIDREFNPLAAYAILEAGIGIYCLLLPFFIDLAFPLFQWIYLSLGDSYTQTSLVRFSVCFALLIIPATFMGATLPVLSKFVSREENFIGKDVGTLYSINTFGAVLGAWASAFIFMRLFGVQATTGIAAAVNISIALIIYFLFKPPLKERLPFIETSSDKEGPALKKSEIFILLSFLLSGLTALVYQVVWTRILSLLLGSSVYAFSMILSVFILGLALGTVTASRFLDRLSDLVKGYGLVQMMIGFSSLSIIPLFGRIPFVNRWIYENWGQQFQFIQGANFIIIFGLLFIPTFFMGTQFPIVIKILATKLETVGQNVGRVYAFNTVGAIIGSFLAGFVLIPALGLQTTILSVVFFNVLLGISLLVWGASISFNWKMYVLPGLFVLCVVIANSIPPWDKSVISSGSFMPYRIGDLREAELKKNKILYFKEGMHTTVTTELSTSGNIFLRVNGKTDASLALDMRTQLLSGYLPMLFHPKPESALVIGQGSGITLGAVEQFPVNKINLVEISPAVIEGSRFFDPFNHDALNDKRLSILLEDGRNHIALSQNTYDVIVSEPSNPWISGVGALFTVDFFELLKKRLNPGGLACIWVHTNMSPDSFKSIVRSFTEKFPYVTMWESIAGDDYLLIGSEEEYGLSFEKAQKLLGNEVAGKDLAQIGIRNVPDLMSLMIMSRPDLVEFSKNAPLHTDDNSLLEFNAPEYVYKDERDVLVRQLTPYIKLRPEFVEFENAGVMAEVRKRLSELKRSESQIEEIKRKAKIETLLEKAEAAYNVGDITQALSFYKMVLVENPQHILAQMNMGNIYQELKLTEEAEKAYLNTLKANPFYIFGSLNLARLYVFSGQSDKAITLIKDTLEWYKGDHELSLFLGLAYAFKKDAQLAVKEFETSLKWKPDYSLAHFYLGVQLQKSDRSSAVRHLKSFLRLTKNESEHRNLVLKAEQLLKKL